MNLVNSIKLNISVGVSYLDRPEVILNIVTGYAVQKIRMDLQKLFFVLNVISGNGEDSISVYYEQQFCSIK